MSTSKNFQESAEDKTKNEDEEEESKKRHQLLSLLWWSKNPNPVAKWKLPDGKTFSNFFVCRKEPSRPNSMGWPKFKSHNPRSTSKKHLCLECQCVGSCSNSCGMSHVDPEKLSELSRKVINDRMKLILG